MTIFGRLSTLLVVLTCLLLPFPAAAARHFDIGLQLYTVRDDCSKDFPGTLKAVAAMGYAGVEFSNYFGHSAEDLRKMLDDDHLKCYGSHISLDDLLGDNFTKTIAFNKTLGNTLLVVPSLATERRSTKAEIIETAKLFSELARKLKPYGMMLAYHDHAGDFQLVEGDFFWNTFFANADSKVKIQFDIGNALEAGQQAAPYLQKYPGRTVSVHIKDFSKTNPKALLGEGDEDWATVIPMLKARNGPRRLIVEQETYPFPPLECAEKCLHNLQAMLAKY